MKTARMPSTPWSSKRAVSAEEIDDFIQSKLQSSAAEGHSPDESLGPYVASMLRMAECKVVTDLPDYDGLIELIQEHCGIHALTEAEKVLKEVAFAVFEQEIPAQMQSGPFLAPITVNEAAFPSLSEAAETPSSALSESQADGLLPQSLLEEEEPVAKSVTGEETNDVAFPSISDAIAINPKKTIPPRSRERGSFVKPRAAEDLRSTNFRSTSHSRHGSYDESHASTSSSPNLSASSPPIVSSMPQQDLNSHYSSSSSLQATAYDAEPIYELEQVHHMLMSMNVDLSADVSYAAAMVAHCDVNLAQYVINTAMSAAPVCRHLLQGGCYRRDCQFSHNVEEHTCLFWMQGRCGKGQACRFLHGFSEKVVDEITQANAVYSEANRIEESKEHQAQHPIVPSEPGSFAHVASVGFNAKKHAFPELSSGSSQSKRSTSRDIPTARIPMDLWNPHENRDAAAFYIADPMERFRAVMSTHKDQRGKVGSNIIDLHFQSTSTFAVVLREVLPRALAENDEVWIITGTGHHVGSRTHQKGGGALESAALDWLVKEGYRVARGRDRNGQGGAILVKK